MLKEFSSTVQTVAVFFIRCALQKLSSLGTTEGLFIKVVLLFLYIVAWKQLGKAGCEELTVLRQARNALPASFICKQLQPP